jgi:hypothetical protein
MFVISLLLASEARADELLEFLVQLWRESKPAQQRPAGLGGDGGAEQISSASELLYRDGWQADSDSGFHGGLLSCVDLREE